MVASKARMADPDSSLTLCLTSLLPACSTVATLASFLLRHTGQGPASLPLYKSSPAWTDPAQMAF